MEKKQDINILDHLADELVPNDIDLWPAIHDQFISKKEFSTQEDIVMNNNDQKKQALHIKSHRKNGWLSKVAITATSLLLLVVIILSTTQSRSLAQNSIPTPLAGREGKIAFMTDRDGNMEIYLMDADGRNLINLTNNDASESYPTWSPDGSKIAFISTRTSNYELNGFYEYEI